MPHYEHCVHVNTPATVWVQLGVGASDTDDKGVNRKLPLRQDQCAYLHTSVGQLTKQRQHQAQVTKSINGGSQQSVIHTAESDRTQRPPLTIWLIRPNCHPSWEGQHNAVQSADNCDQECCQREQPATLLLKGANMSTAWPSLLAS
jgi:hypothetical protein